MSGGGLILSTDGSWLKYRYRKPTVTCRYINTGTFALQKMRCGDRVCVKNAVNDDCIKHRRIVCTDPYLLSGSAEMDLLPPSSACFGQERRDRDQHLRSIVRFCQFDTDDSLNFKALLLCFDFFFNLALEHRSSTHTSPPPHEVIRKITYSSENQRLSSSSVCRW